METICSEKNKINCEIHTDVQIDHFCSQHDVVCCRTCLSMMNLQVEILWHWLFIKKILTFLIKKINIIILKCRLFISLIARLLFVQSPLDSASKDVKNSSLLSDTLEEQEYMTETLSKMEDNRPTRSMALRETSSTAYNIMLTTEITNLDVCVYFTVYFVFFWTNCFHDESTSRNIMTLIIYKKNLNISNKKKSIL
jgi:hypothetical protein